MAYWISEFSSELTRAAGSSTPHTVLLPGGNPLREIHLGNSLRESDWENRTSIMFSKLQASFPDVP
jgi:hypothetical protein